MPAEWSLLQLAASFLAPCTSTQTLLTIAGGKHTDPRTQVEQIPDVIAVRACCGLLPIFGPGFIWFIAMFRPRAPSTRQELRQSKEPKLDPAQANACAAQVPAQSGYEQAGQRRLTAQESWSLL